MKKKLLGVSLAVFMMVVQGVGARAEEAKPVTSLEDIKNLLDSAGIEGDNAYP